MRNRESTPPDVHLTAGRATEKQPATRAETDSPATHAQGGGGVFQDIPEDGPEPGELAGSALEDVALPRAH